jgi:hypothetical protein
MLIEIWERLRGYNKWAEAEATIVSYETVRRRLGAKAAKSISGRFSTDLLSWKDAEGQRHYGAFVNQDTSSLYQMLDGEQFQILYNPANPDRYYHRGYFLHLFGIFAKAIAGLAIWLGMVGWVVWTIIAHHGR